MNHEINDTPGASPSSDTHSSVASQPFLLETQPASLCLPIPSTTFEAELADRRSGFKGPRTSNGSNDSSLLDPSACETDEEEEEESVPSPTSVQYPINVKIEQHASNAFIHRTQAQTSFSTSLPASFSQSYRQLAPPQDECSVTQELLKITKQLRDGILSPERLLPANRIKQTGVGGRGRRHFSTSGPTTAGPKPDSNPRFPEPKFAQSFHEPVILRAPRAVRAWERP